MDGPEHLLRLPISDIALQQLTTLAQELTSLQQSSESDIWSYIWGSPYFSSPKAYSHLTGHIVTHIAFKWLRNSACQNKHKVFFGSLCMIDCPPGNCLRGKIWHFSLISVCVATCQLKNHYRIFSTIDCLQKAAGNCL